MTELKEVVIPVEGITIEANRTEVTAGGTVTFTANLTPAGASGEVTYTITEGTELGSIEGNVLTTTAVGTIKVQATVDELTSNEVTITVNEASETDPEPVEAFNASFSNSTATGGYKDQDFKLDEKDFHMNTGQCANNVFYLGHNKSLGNYSLKDGMTVSEEYNGYTYVEMMFDITKVTSVSYTYTQADTATSHLFILESTDGGTTWTEVAKAEVSEDGGTISYNPESEVSNARYALVVGANAEKQRVYLTDLVIMQLPY